MLFIRCETNQFVTKVAEPGPVVKDENNQTTTTVLQSIDSELDASEPEDGQGPKFDILHRDRTSARRLKLLSFPKMATLKSAEDEGLSCTEDQPLFPQKEETAEVVGGGVVQADLDEAAHSVYVIYKYGHKAASQLSFNELQHDISDEAALISSDPKGWLRAQVSQTGRADTVIDFGLSAVIVPLSMLAIKAGIEETQEALQHHASLTATRNKIIGNLQSFQLVSSDDLSQNIISSQAKEIEQQDLMAIDSALKHNFYNGGIGCNSLLSGGAIFTKVIQDTTLKVVTLYTAQTGALTTATTVIGVAGTVVLGPIAALAAVGMGGFFVHQARQVAEELAQDRQISTTISASKLSQASKPEQVYQAFIDHEFTARESFVGSFKRWNMGFLAGACGYALSAVAKAVIGIAALSGTAVFLATPVGLAIILGLGIAGGITMGVCSWQFLMSHGKSKQHQAYRLQELAFLGRRFDSLQTVHADSDAQTVPSVRVALYDFISQRDLLNQGFLHTIACERNKFRQWEQSSVDAAGSKDGVPKINKDSKNRQRYKNLLAQLSYVSVYLSQRLSGNAHQPAMYAAQKVRGLQADDLSTFDVTEWLTEPKHEQAQRKLLTDMLRMQCFFLEQKIRSFIKFGDLSLPSDDFPQEVQKTFAQAKEEVRLDIVRLEKIENLVDTLPEVPLNILQREFLRLEGISVTDVAEEELTTRVAQHLNEELSDELTTTHGILFDMHRRAVRLQQACLKENRREDVSEIV